MRVAVIILSLMLVSVTIAYLKAVYRLGVISQAIANFVEAKEDLEKANASIFNTREDYDQTRENFIKFLSDSRDWAYQYIEDVQGGIKKFLDEVGPQIEYYNKYGLVVEGMIPSHDFALKKISKEIEELKKFLPEESNDRR